MKEAREKMTLREHVQIALRAVKRTFAFEKRYAVSLLMQAVLKAVIPYVPVYFSAKVIDALCAGGARAAAQYAAAAVGLRSCCGFFRRSARPSRRYRPARFTARRNGSMRKKR